MSLFDELSLEERARQLRNPTGEVGLAVAGIFADVNRNGNASAVAGLRLSADDRVLEVGCGLATMAPAVLAAADGVRYTGLDSSESMIDGARKRNATLVRAGHADFHLARAENMPFGHASFTKVFSIGVIHFWDDPVAALREVARVMRPGAFMVMGCLAPEHAPPFARPEFGFYLRSAEEWQAACAAAGLSHIQVRTSDLAAKGGSQVFELEAYA